VPAILLFQGKAFQVAINDFSPRQGAIGATVTITGLGFTGATAVSFNNVPAQSFTVVSDTTLTAVVATGTTTGKIKVTAPLGIGVSAVDFIELTLNKEDRILGEIERPTVKEYTLEYFVSRPYTIKNLVIGTSSGTATVSIQINGVNVSGLTNLTVSSTQLNAPAGNNLAALSSIITLRVISVNNAVNLKFNLIYDYV
jgi:hypothetical protein